MSYEEKLDPNSYIGYKFRELLAWTEGKDRHITLTAIVTIRSLHIYPLAIVEYKVRNHLTDFVFITQDFEEAVKKYNKEVNI